ncbi:hypothetical protein RF55_5220 [Lasius niger]|uniref:Uncharacterized protein n=1 Tax=Lasius niger TaxID=67767 RepID=A0A0J7KWF2_LASNI|nr:hypothetical protein RF55_5220 [Lasius niger]
MSEKSVSAKLTIAEPLERSTKSTACEIKEHCSKKKIASSEIPMEKSKEIAIEVTEKHEAQKAKSTKDDKAGKAIPAKAPEKSAVNIKLAEAPEVTKVRETLKKEYPKEIQDVKLEKFEIPKVIKMQETLKTESTKNVKDDKSAIPTKDPEESHVKNTKPAEASEVAIVYKTPKEEPPKDIKDTKLKFFADASELSEVLTVSTKDVEDDSLEISLQDSEESNVKDKPAEGKPVKDAKKTNKIPVLRKVK